MDGNVPAPEEAPTSGPWELFSTRSAKQTMALGRALAERLRGGDCVALHGEMGAGKTQLVRGLVEGLGGPVERVCSPTYVLLNIYRGGRLTVYHLDAYRVGTEEDFEGIGFGELLEQGGVVVVEWAARVGQLLPPQHWQIHIHSPRRTWREIRLRAGGSKG